MTPVLLEEESAVLTVAYLRVISQSFEDAQRYDLMEQLGEAIRLGLAFEALIQLKNYDDSCCLVEHENVSPVVFHDSDSGYFTMCLSCLEVLTMPPNYLPIPVLRPVVA